MNNDVLVEDEELEELFIKHWERGNYYDAYNDFLAVLKSREHEAELRGRKEQVTKMVITFKTTNNIQSMSRGQIIGWLDTCLAELTAPTTDDTATDGGES